jgi:Protein of unknown function (DUF4013)
MNISENISDSLQYPTKDWVKIIILGILLIIPIVDFIALGYYLRIIKSTLAGLDELPDFDSVGELFIDGIKILIVGIIYAIVPLIFYALAFAFAGPATVTSSTTTASSFSYSYVPALTGISVVFFIIAVILAIIISIFAYMGIANMAYYDSEIGAALRYREILDRIAAIGWGNYIIWWIVLMLTLAVVGFIIAIVGGILLFILIGFLVFLFGYGYLIMFQARSVALIFASSGEYEAVDEPPEEENPVE